MMEHGRPFLYVSEHLNNGWTLWLVQQVQKLGSSLLKDAMEVSSQIFIIMW
jgi:hypothetical protein